MTDLTKLSDDDLLALKAGDLSKVSDAGLLSLRDSAGSGQSGIEKAAALATAPLEAAKTIATGTAGTVAGGLAGIAGTLLPGPQGQGRDWLEAIQNRLTMQPTTPQGQSLTNAITYLPSKLAQGADVLGGGATDMATARGASPEVAGSIGTAINAITQSIPQLLARGLKAPVENIAATAEARAAGLKSANSVRDTSIKAALDEGAVLPPSSVNGGSFIGNRVEGIAGKAALGQETAARNQPVFDRIARQEAGLAPNQPITVDTLKAARNVIAAPYEEFAQLPGLPAPRYSTQLNPTRPAYSMFGKTPPTPSELIHDWKSANKTASDLWTDYKASNGKIEILDKYREAIKAKDAIETSIENTAVASGRGDLVPALRDARVRFAKNFDVERALNLGSGEVDAAIIGRMLDSGKKLSPGLATIGKFNQAVEARFTREGAKSPSPNISKAEGFAALVGGLGGHALLGPYGLALGALPLMSLPARHLMLSKAMQSPPTYGAGPISAAPAMLEAGGAMPALSPLAELQRRQQP